MRISTSIYTNFWKHYCEVLQLVLDDPNCYQDACPLMGRHVPSMYCASNEWSVWYYEGIKWLLSFKEIINHQSIGCCMWCDPKSYNRSYMHFSVPWILALSSNDPCAGTTNDCDCYLHWPSVCVGICSICRPWFSQSLVGCKALPLHL